MGEGYRALSSKVIITVPTPSIGTGIVISPVNGNGGITSPGIGNRAFKFGTAHDQITRYFNCEQGGRYRYSYG